MWGIVLPRMIRIGSLLYGLGLYGMGYQRPLLPVQPLDSNYLINLHIAP